MNATEEVIGCDQWAACAGSWRWVSRGRLAANTHHDPAHHHHHHHHAHAIIAADGDRRVIGAVVVNLGLTVVQIIAGVLSGSLALIADAIHILSDAMALVIALVARRIAHRPADEDMTFG